MRSASRNGSRSTSMNCRPLPVRSWRSDSLSLAMSARSSAAERSSSRVDDVAHVRGSAPRPAFAEDPVTVPDMAGQAAVLLDLVEPGRRDDRQRVLLAVHHLGLQRRVELVEIDRAGPAPSALNSDVRIGAAGTRILKSFRSSGVLISRVTT